MKRVWFYILITLILLALLSIGFLYVNEFLFRFIFSVSFILSLTIGSLLVHNTKELNKQREELQSINSHQTQLLHFIAHQVKGFFTRSRNIFAGILEGDFGSITEETKKMAKEGFSSDSRAVEVIQDILRAANLQQGKIEYAMEDIDLAEILQQESGLYTALAESKGLIFRLKLDNAKKAIVKGDKEYLRHVFKNMIDNSVKYTPNGYITISLFTSNREAIVSIKDSGIGLSQHDKENLFKESGRGRRSLGFNIDSTGFGLYIVKKIVEGHNGRVWAESEGENKGSTFFVSLPLSDNKSKVNI